MINVLNEQGVSFQINVNRFFEVNNNQYLIYNTSEKDEAGYVKLYLSKNVNGFFIKVEDENEWNIVKDLIKTIVKEINENNLNSVSDLDYRRLENQTIISAKNFKLSEQVSNMLSSNKKVFEMVLPSKVEEQIPSNDQIEISADNQIQEEIKPFSLDLDDEEEPKSYEELLAQIKGFKENISKEVEEEQPIEKTAETNNSVENVELQQKVSDVKISSEPEVIAKVDALEVLLGQVKSNEVSTKDTIKEEPKLEEKPVVKDDLKLEDRIKMLEKQIEEYEVKFNKIKEILK
jgi:hypothetical protein